jgi:hypothetical protein
MIEKESVYWRLERDRPFVLYSTLAPKRKACKITTSSLGNLEIATNPFYAENFFQTSEKSSMLITTQAYPHDLIPYVAASRSFR